MMYMGGLHTGSVDTLFSFQQSNSILNGVFCPFMYVKQLFPTSLDLIPACLVFSLHPILKGM